MDRPLLNKVQSDLHGRHSFRCVTVFGVKMIPKEVPVVTALVITVRTQECLVMFMLSVDVNLK